MVTAENPLAPALKAVRLAWLEAAAVYEPTNTPVQEAWAIHRALTAIEAAHAHLAALRSKRGLDDGVDLTNLVAFKQPKERKGKKRKAGRALQ